MPMALGPTAMPRNCAADVPIFDCPNPDDKQRQDTNATGSIQSGQKIFMIALGLIL